MKNFLRNDSRYLTRILVVCCSLLCFTTVLNAQIVVDGFTNDWDAIHNLNPQPADYRHVQDAFGNGVVDDQFTEGSKDILPAEDWVWSISQTKAKNDIANGAVFLKGDTLFFAGDRTSNNGDAQIGFWLFLDGTAPTAYDGKKGTFAPPHNSSPGDILVLSDFTGGGKNGTVTVYQWVGAGGNADDPQFNLIDVASEVAENNGGPEPIPNGWNYIDVEYETNAFYEGYVELDAELFGEILDNLCGSHFILETRSSQELTASLDDFVGGPFISEIVCSASAQDASAFAAKDGVFAVSVEGGSPDYMYEVWKVSGGYSAMVTTSDTLLIIDTLGFGDYAVAITDELGCSNDTCYATIGFVATAPICEVTPTPVTCFGGTDGSIEAYITSSPNVPPFTYILKDQSDNPLDTIVSSDTTVVFSGLSAGVYLVDVYDNIDPNATFCGGEITEPDEVTLTCPSDIDLGSCLTQDSVNTAFDAWLASVASSGSDSTITNDWDQVYPDACGDTITVRFTLDDPCLDPNFCDAMFMVSAAPAVTFDDLPVDEEVSACDLEDQAAMVQAFSDWVAAQELALNLGGGCSPVLDSDADQVVLNDLCLGDTVTVTWTINDKCIEEIEASAMFMVSAAPAVTFDDLPVDEEVSACDLEDQAAMVQAFSDWVAAQELALNLGGGCSPVLDSDADQVVLNDLCLGDTVTVTWTINDKCIEEIEASAMFMVSAAPAVTFDDLPVDEEVSACDLEDQAAMVQAFSDWVAAQELALNLGGGCSPVLDSDADQVVLNDLCLGDTVTVTWTINDKCIEEIEASAMFMVSAAPAVTFDDLPVDEEVSACDLEDQAAMVQAFSDWVAAQELALNLGGGCSPVLDSDADQVVLNDLCLGDTVTVTWTINDKCIEEIEASAMFMVSAAPAVTFDDLPVDEEVSACDLEDQAAMVQAFSDWVAAQELALNLGGGCSPVLDSDADQVVLNDLCLGDTVTVTWTINDKCIDEIEASAMFMVSAAPAVTFDDLPVDEEVSACDLEDQAAMVQAFSDWVAAQELALNLGGGCSPVLDSDADQVVLNDLCLGDTVTVTWTINDKCIEEIEASAMFMVSAAPAVTFDDLPVDEEVSACDLEDQAAMVQAFSDWVAAQELALNLGGGCSPVLDSDADQVVLNDLCLGDTVTVTWTINDKCIEEIEASAMFMVSAAPAVTFDDLPVDEEVSACDLEDQAAMVQAFSDWVAAQELALNLGGGCSPVLDSDADQVVLNDLCLGDTVTVTWTINDKCIDEIEASAMFMVSAAPAVTFDDLPVDEEVSACDLEDQAAMVQAFSDWVAAQELALNLGGGCSPVLDSDADQVVLNDLCLGDTVTVTWTINDKCIDEIEASAMFMVSAAPAVTFDDLPVDEEVSACDLEDQAAMVQAFSDWVAAQELALNLGGGCSPVLDSDADQVVLNDLCLGDTVTVTWTINDKCIDEIEASAMFMVSAAPAVTFDDLPVDEEVSACDLEDQAAMVQAFSDWVAAQELALNLGGGCSPVLDSDADQVVLNDLCLGDTVTVTWTINDKCIDEIEASAMFMVSAAPAVTFDDLPVDEEVSACDLEDQAAMVQAFSDWVAAQELALNLGGGCSPVLDSDADQVVLNDLCLGDTVTVTWTINDKCIDEIEASAMFMVSAAPAVTFDDLPVDEEVSACDLEDQAAMVQAFSDWVAAQELALNLGGGCSPVLDSDADQVVLNDLCLGDTVTVTWTINDKCIEEIEASAMFMVSAAPAVTFDDLPVDEEVSACDLEDQAAMVQAFSDWVAAQELALNLGGGCSPVLDSDADQVVLNDLCLGDTVTVTWTINDKCIDEIEASAMFMVSAAPAVTFDDLPVDEEVSACDLEDQAAMVQAFSDWVAAQELALNLGGGCSPVLDSDADQVVLNDLCLGDTVTVTWTINDKCIDEIEASAMFMVSAAPAVTFDDLPVDEEVSACDLEDQAAMVQAFSDWVAAQELALNLGGGCSPVLDSDADQVVLNDLCLGDTVTVTWTINDKCIEEIEASAMFMVSAAPAVTFDDLPVDEEVSACDLEDQAAMVQAFSDWVAAQELALNLGGGCSPVLDSDADQVVLNDLCLGDTVTVTWTINDKCIEEIEASAMFMVSAAPAVTFDDLPVDEEVSACDLEDQAAMVQAFNDWVAAQELALNLGGGCSPVLDSDADQVVLNDLCLGDTVTVTWTINDKCIEEIEASAMFMVSAAPAVTFDDLPVDEEVSACDLEDQAAMVQAFSDWVAAQELALNLGGGCSPVLDSDADQVVLNDLCLGDTVTVTWTINDKCIDEIEASAMFMVSAAPAVTFDDLPVDEEVSACDLEDQAAMVQAFSDWVAAQELALNLGGGCSPVLDSDADQVVLNDLCLGDTVTVTWTINDKCIDEIEASAMFMVSAAPAVTFDDLPVDEEVSACDLEDQAAMVQAFSDWVAAQELALNLGGGCSPVLDSDADQVVLNDLCLGDTVTVTWTINDKCIEEIEASAMFMVSAAPAVTFDDLPVDEEVSACDLEDQAAMVQAFSDWVAAQELALNLGGGCSPVLDSDADQVVLNDLCLGDTVTVTWTINDKCIDEIEASAMFMVSGDTAPELIAPANDTLCDGELPIYLVASWTDECLGSGMDTAWMVPVADEDICSESAMYYFMVEDSCGNVGMDTTVVVNNFNIYENCETAFGKAMGESAMCFLEHDFNRWGWTNHVVAEDAEGEAKDTTFMLTLWAGAAHCETDNGDSVGVAYVSYTAETQMLSVEYIIADGYAMKEAHVYVGCEMFPMQKKGKSYEPTVAPGQYTFNSGGLMYSNNIAIDFSDVSSEFYIIVHAVTCEEICRCAPRPGVDDGNMYDGYSFEECMEEEVASESGDEGKGKGKGKVNKSITTDINIFERSKFKAFPNPFDEVVNFEFVPAVGGHAVLEIHNMLGQRVVRLLDRPVEAGELQRVEFRPETDISGMYLYRLDIDGESRIGKLIYRNR